MKVTRIHQIELTSKCNLACKYCVHPKMPRPKEDMDWVTFEHALIKVKYCMVKYGQNELNLAGIGESTMHPAFAQMFKHARRYLGQNIKLVIATNGVSFTEEIAQEIAEYDPWVWVSLHRPEKAGQAVEIAKRYGMLKGVSADPSVAAMNWAGQTDWHVSCNTETPCPWLTNGMAMVMSDGRVTTCCLDGSGDGVIGYVTDDINDLEVQPYSLCENCHHAIPETA